MDIQKYNVSGGLTKTENGEYEPCAEEVIKVSELEEILKSMKIYTPKYETGLLKEGRVRAINDILDIIGKK